MTGKTMTAAFLCAAAAATVAAGDQELMIEKTKVRPIRAEFTNQYEEDEIVRVHIVFDKEAVEETSLDEMIENLEQELPEGVLDVHNKKLQGYDITANVAYGKIEEIRSAEGVESVRLEKRYDFFEPSQPVPDGQDVPEETDLAKEPDTEETAEQEVMEEEPTKTGNGSAYALLAAGGSAAVAGTLYWKRKDKKKK